MPAIRWNILLTFGFLLGGCGLAVPEIQEFPGGAADGQLFVYQIVHNVKCELIDAVHYVDEQDRKYAKINGGRIDAWFDDWGIQTTLQLTIDEKGTVNPVANWTPISPVTSVFNLAGTASLTSDANRIDKLNSYDTVQYYLHLPRCTDRPDGTYLLQSDLKLKEWLFDVIQAQNTASISITDKDTGQFKATVISHEIKFEVTSTGGLTPGWKLTRVAVNQSGNLLSATRDRTHDLTITLGPTVLTPIGEKTVTAANGKKTKVPVYQPGPTDEAAAAHLASLIGTAVGNAVKSALTTP